MYPSNGSGGYRYDASMDRGWSPYAIASAGPPPATPSYSHAPSASQSQSSQQYMPYQPLSGQFRYTYGGGTPRVDYTNYATVGFSPSSAPQRPSPAPSLYQSPYREYKGPVTSTPPMYGTPKKSNAKRDTSSTPGSTPSSASGANNSAHKPHSSSSPVGNKKKTLSSSSASTGTSKHKKTASSVVSIDEYRKFISSSAASAGDKSVLSPLAQMRAYEEFKRSMAPTIADESSSSSISSPPLSPSSSEASSHDRPPSPSHSSFATVAVQQSDETLPLAIEGVDAPIESAIVVEEAVQTESIHDASMETCAPPDSSSPPIVTATTELLNEPTENGSVNANNVETHADTLPADEGISGTSSDGVLSLHLSAEVVPTNEDEVHGEVDVQATAATSQMEVDEPPRPLPNIEEEEDDDDLTEEESETRVVKRRTPIIKRSFCPTGDHTVPNTPPSEVEEEETDVTPPPPSPTPAEDERTASNVTAVINETESKRRIAHLVEYISSGVAEKRFQFGKQTSLLRTCRRHLIIVQHLLSRGVALTPDMYEIKSLIQSVPLMDRSTFTKVTLRQIPHLLRCRVNGFIVRDKKTTNNKEASPPRALVGTETEDSLPPPSEARTKFAKRPLSVRAASTVGVVGEAVSVQLKSSVDNLERDYESLARLNKVAKKSESHLAPSSLPRPAAMDLEGYDTDDSETFNGNLIACLADIVDDAINDVKRRLIDVLDDKSIRARVESAILKTLERI